MPDTIIESVLTGKLDTALFIKWVNNESIENTPEDCLLYCCNRNEFVAYFLSYLRSQTDSILQTNSNAIQILQHSTPEKLLSMRRKHCRSISDPTSDDRTMDSLSVKSDKHNSQESPTKDHKRGRKVKTKLFPDDRNLSISSDESRLSSGIERLVLSSTPMKNDLRSTEFQNLTSPVTLNPSHHERCDTPRLSHRHSRSHEKSCLGDYFVNVKSAKKKKPDKKNDSDIKLDLDLSNSEMFPEIGAKKSNSLKSEKRRIKPTNIDRSSQKNCSMNSFSADSFHQLSPLALQENAVFNQQKLQPKELSNSFEVERNILKQERHKLMEKFNILNTFSSPKSNITPQIKVSQKDSFEKNKNYTKTDITKVSFKDRIDILVDIYDILLKNNLILSINTEIYFLVSILVSKQYNEDCLNAEMKLNNNNFDFLLKSIHNSTYFAVKSLWNLRAMLEVILDKNSLKTLGENKKVRSFYPELAKFLLNCYGLRCEAESTQEKPRVQEGRVSSGVICFNSETDNAENFPSTLSFHSFKKQRDMFYEILRWYQETLQTGGSRSSFRARVKTLISGGTSPANHKHLAALFTKHMLAECPPNTQESKLSKLQRRLTCPAAPESHRLPHFTDKETFYKEFIINAENECFRVHLRDALSTEIIILDSTHIPIEDRGNSNKDISKEYLQLTKKLSLLSKFLGFLTSLPYTQTADLNSKTGVIIKQKEQKYNMPKERVLESDIVLRNYSQPAIDLIGILTNAYENSRLSITIPWIVHYLSMLDYTSLRIKYYQEIHKILFDIYSKLKLNSENNLKKNTIIFLKSVLGWLFDLPHFPQDLLNDKNRLNINVASEVNIDCCDVIDESIIFDLCPYLRDVNVLLSTCRVSHEQKEMCSYRHITPVSLSMNIEHRIKNKEKEIQARLEEEFLKSQPASTRRVLELVTERVTSACGRELAATVLVAARRRAAERAGRLARAPRLARDPTVLLQSLQTLYSEHVQELRANALEIANASIKTRVTAALSALLPAPAAAPATSPAPAPAPPLAPLHALAARSASNRLAKWLADNWNTTAILCKDIESEMKTLIALGDVTSSMPHKSTVDVEAMTSPEALFNAVNVSPATCIINLKEQICVLLEEEVPEQEWGEREWGELAAACAASCSARNVLAGAGAGAGAGGAAAAATLQLSLDLCLVLVSRKPKEVTDTFLNKLHGIWNVCCPDRKRAPPEEITLPERRADLSPEFRNFDDEEPTTAPTSDDETDGRTVKIDYKNGYNCNNQAIPSEATSKTPESKPTTPESTPITPESNFPENSDGANNELLHFFDRILCPRNIVLLSASKCKASDVWEGLASVLVFLLKNDYLSEDSLTEQCLAVYRQDWPQNVLESLSTCMKSVSSKWSRSSVGKFTLFLDFLSEYCGDMDYEPLD